MFLPLLQLGMFSGNQIWREGLTSINKYSHKTIEVKGQSLQYFC